MDIQERRERLLRERDEAIEQIQAAFQVRMDAMERAEKLMELASGNGFAESAPALAETPDPSPAASAPPKKKRATRKHQAYGGVVKRIKAAVEATGGDFTVKDIRGSTKAKDSSIRGALRRMVKRGDLEMVVDGKPFSGAVYHKVAEPSARTPRAEVAERLRQMLSGLAEPKTRQELSSMLRDDGVETSTGTVWHCLKVLVEAGEAAEHPTGEGRTIAYGLRSTAGAPATVVGTIVRTLDLAEPDQEDEYQQHH